MAEKKELKLYRIGPGRFSYPYPLGFKNEKGETRYGCQLLLTTEHFKNCSDAQELIQAVNALGREKVSENFELKTARNKCIQKTDEMEVRDEATKGLICFKATSKNRITVYGADGKEMDEEDIKKIKGGYWGYIIVNPFAYNTQGNKGISLGVNAMQFWKKDTEFGNMKKAVAACITELEVPVTDPVGAMDPSSAI